MKPLSWYKDLADSKKRRECGCFLVEGRRAIGQIKIAAAAAIEEILITERLSAESKKFSCPVRLLTDSQFDAVCTSKTPQGIAAVVRVPEDAYSDELPRQTGNRLLLLEGLQDPGNVGTLVRTAAAFDFSGIVLSDKCADPFSPKAIQASAGSIMAVWTRRSARYLDMALKLKDRNFTLIAADIKGDLPVLEKTTVRPVIMLGSEGAGLSDGLLDLADEKVRIPMNGRKAESLNVAASGAILMFLWNGNQT